MKNETRINLNKFEIRVRKEWFQSITCLLRIKSNNWPSLRLDFFV